MPDKQIIMVMQDLAIVIPAYKSVFFKETLESIAAQSNLNFHVYIGDDNSPEDLQGIAELYSDKLKLTYYKFEDNLGSHNLTAHWSRCIALCNEEWIWLFSDDDIMEDNCVETFYAEKNNRSNFAAYKFNTFKVNAANNILHTNISPTIITGKIFLTSKLNAAFESYMVEYIFSRKAYEAIGGIPHFPLAWTSDDAFWTLMAYKGGIKTLTQGHVHWRWSNYNISGTTTEKKNADAKLDACLQFLHWLQRNSPDQFPVLYARWFSKQIKDTRASLSRKERWSYAKQFLQMYPAAFFSRLFSFVKYSIS